MPITSEISEVDLMPHWPVEQCHRELLQGSRGAPYRMALQGFGSFPLQICPALPWIVGSILDMPQKAEPLHQGTFDIAFTQ